MGSLHPLSGGQGSGLGVRVGIGIRVDRNRDTSRHGNHNQNLSQEPGARVGSGISLVVELTPGLAWVNKGC